MASLWRDEWLMCSLACASLACDEYGADLLVPPPQAGGASAGAATMGGSSDANGGLAAAGGGTGGIAGAASGGGAGGAESASLPRLRGTVVVAPVEVDMTEEGSRDWAHWGFADDDDEAVYNHKAAVTSQLLDFVPIDAAWSTQRASGAVAFKWSDGTPTSSATTYSSVFWQGLQQGFEMVVPAADELRRVRLYVSARDGTAEIRAKLSDPKAQEAFLDRLQGSSASWSQYLVTIEYGLAAEASRLELAFEVVEAQSAGAAVALGGVTFDAP